MTEMVTAASQAAGAGAREAHPGFEVYDSEFAAALGPAPRLTLVAATDAHEGPVYIPGEDVLYFTTLPGKVDIPAPGTPCAYVKRLALDGLNFPVDPSRLSVVPARVNRRQEGAAVQRRLPGPRRRGLPRHRGTGRAEWHRAVPGRTPPLRRQLGPGSQDRYALHARR